LSVRSGSRRHFSRPHCRPDRLLNRREQCRI